jgi:hypothetical protein
MIRLFLLTVVLIWNLPNTLLGLLIGSLNFTFPDYSHGAVNFYMKRGPVPAICNFLKISAFTVGECVLYAVPPNPNLRTHEFRHVLQYRVLGPFFLPVYFVLLGLYGYVRHPLERDARNFELIRTGKLYQGKLFKKPD